jgi:uncharacterized repeat protein (TIGR03843 family)
VNEVPSTTDILRDGECVSCRLTAAGSNYTFLAEYNLDGQVCLGIYKPKDGEAPLWDFPRGTLYKREYAAYLLSQVLGWNFVPFTLIRDGPYGIGSVQRYVDHDARQNYYNLDNENLDTLKTIACFDLVANSTDRKANHILLDGEGNLWGIDNGLTFHADTKIRTVIWDFCGEAIPQALLTNLSDFKSQIVEPTGLVKEMLDLLLPEEGVALKHRVEWVLSEGTYPGVPGRYRRRRR